MKQKLLFLRKEAQLAVCVLLSFVAYGQTIGIPTVNASGGPVSISFSVGNGLGAINYFNGNTDFTVYLSDASGSNFVPVHAFNSSVFPQSTNLASATITTTVPIPAGTPSGTGYKIAISSASPTSIGIAGDNASAAFALFSGFTMPATLNGFIKCSSPAVNYYVLTLTNTGNVTDSYGFTKIQTLYPLGSQFYSLSGAIISGTPVLDPGESYTFMMRFDTPNGTPPDNWNTTVVTATSNNYGTIQVTSISTYIYCGGNNPNLPDAPDMEIVKTANTANATVGDFIDYTITIKNTSTRNASNPVIKDFIPANAELISYNKAPGETRSVLFSYNAANTTLTALVQSTMTTASLPLTIHVRVKTYCQSAPLVTNTAEVYTVSGDYNTQNDVATATTAVTYNLADANVGRWTGSFNSDWFDCRNWSGGVIPNNSIDVVVPPATPIAEISALSPKAPADKTARTHHLLISAGGSVGMTNAGLYHIAGNWSSNGNFFPGDGSVTFMGSVNGMYQAIADTTGKTEFYNLEVNTAGNSKGLGVPDGFGLFVHHTLALTNGNLRMNGKSQLVQTKSGATGNPAGNGKMYIDQQGKSNIFSYNYWSSPVGTNNSYTVGEVLKDGTDPSNPLNITWTSGYNGAPTSPISLSPYWINKYQNQSNSYANWSFIGPNGTLSAGQGYTMKGSGGGTPLQNYTFAGQPNDGNLTSMVSPNNMNLSGNPYPCALDAYAFIDDNAATITGTLYFWEQFSTNSSHITANYEGGYATMTKTGATPPTSPIGISSAGFSTRVPHRYIPVGQGFLLFGSSSGGTITYGNNQRAFVKESSNLSNPMFRTAPGIAGPKKIRLGFGSASAMTQRQILLGFMDAATDGFDKGYDAIQIDTRDNDLYFPLNNAKLVIQAKGAFSESEIVPLGIRLGTADVVTFNLDDTENFENSNVFLHDAASNTYHDLKQEPVTIALGQGIYDSRFSLRFAHSDSRVAHSEGQVDMAYSGGMLQIQNHSPEKISQVKMYNTIGQEIQSWTVNQSENSFTLPVSDWASGMYLTHIQCGNQQIIKRIIIH